MLSSKLLELNAAKARVARLEAEVAGELHRSFVDLPSQFGFDDTSSFLDAVRAAAGTTMRQGRKAVAKATKRTRARITEGTRTAVKQLVQAGRTGSAIATELGISVPSVQAIKKALGLVRTTQPAPAKKVKRIRAHKPAASASRKPARRPRSPQAAPTGSTPPSS